MYTIDRKLFHKLSTIYKSYFTIGISYIFSTQHWHNIKFLLIWTAYQSILTMVRTFPELLVENKHENILILSSREFTKKLVYSSDNQILILRVHTLQQIV